MRRDDNAHRVELEGAANDMHCWQGETNAAGKAGRPR